MGKVIIPNAVQRKPGYIYYINGRGDICEAVSAVGKGRQKAKKKAVKKTAAVKRPARRKRIKKI